MNWRILARFTPILIALGGVAFSLSYLSRRNFDEPDRFSSPSLRVLSYSGFLAPWGPGPELAKLFSERTGIKVEFRDAGDAGLLIKKLELFPSDVVIGLDELSLDSARAAVNWRGLPKGIVTDERWRQPEFVAFDWAPMSFIFRQGEIEPPASLQDLLHERFRGAIVLTDPRTSAPGLLFLNWLVDEFGDDGAVRFLKQLKPNLHSVSSGWSQAYGLFSKKQAKLALSYLTSPVYHWTQDKDLSYQAAVFANGHATHVEYAGVPADCRHCEEAGKFLRFLLEDEAQKILMAKNVMLPVSASAIGGSEYAKLPIVKLRASDRLGERDKILGLWLQSEL